MGVGDMPQPCSACLADEVKERIAKDLNNAAAKAWLTKRRAEAPSTTQQKAVDAELQSARKASKTEGNAHAREEARKMQIEKYVSRDPPMPAEQIELCTCVPRPACYCSTAGSHQGWWRGKSDRCACTVPTATSTF